LKIPKIRNHTKEHLAANSITHDGATTLCQAHTLLTLLTTFSQPSNHRYINVLLIFTRTKPNPVKWTIKYTWQKSPVLKFQLKTRPFMFTFATLWNKQQYIAAPQFHDRWFQLHMM